MPLLRSCFAVTQLTIILQRVVILAWEPLLRSKEFDSMDVCESWTFLCRHLKSSIDLSFPKYYPKCQNSKQPYTNHQVIKLKHRKEALWRKYRATGDHLDYHRFTIARNSPRSLTRQLRSKHENKIANFIKQNPKALWKVWAKVKIKPSIPTLVGTDSEATTDVQKADVFDRFFL